MTSHRVKTIVEELEHDLLQLVRKHRVTRDEYREATNVLVAAVKAGEESMLYDVFLEAAVTDVANAERDGTEEAVEGPFYVPGAPQIDRPCELPRRADEPGDTLVFYGRVTGATGAPLAGAELDLWQADAAGLYSNIHPGIPAWNLRGRIHTASDGTFEVRTIVPVPYEIPNAGPTGKVLTALGRHFFRPAHLHVKVRHPGYTELTTQLYFTGSDYLDSDAANAVRDPLIRPLVRRAEPAAIAARDLRAPFFEFHYDFVLAAERE